MFFIMKKMFMCTFLLFVFLIGCDSRIDKTNLSMNEKNVTKDFINSSENTERVKHPIVSLNSRKKIDYLQHYHDNDYEVGIYDEEGNLQWIRFSTYGPHILNRVHKTNKVQEMYLIRTGEQQMADGVWRDTYDIYVPSNQKIDAGVSRSGKGSEETSMMIE